MLVRRLMIGGVVAAGLLLSGCGGSDDDAGTAAPTSAAPAPTAADATTGDAAPSSDAPAGDAGGCLGVAKSVTDSVTKVAAAGSDYAKAATEFTEGAKQVRSGLSGLPAAAAKAGEDVATAMDGAAAAAKTLDTSNPQPYVDAQQKVGTALVALSTACGN